jgi:sugar O-acyltransferase (sialic acid O-acetyltransferase NeuD family)
MTLSGLDLVIIGVGGNSLEIFERIKRNNPNWNIGFLDDTSNHPLVVGKLGEINESQHSKKLFLIGSPKTYKNRDELFEKLKIPKNQLFTFIDDNSFISSSASIGSGCAIMWNTYVGDSSKLGENLLILPNVFIGHDTKIDDHTIIAANVAISSEVTIGKQCYIGSNTTIREGILIGDNALIGAGSVVVTDVPENSTYVGNPARDLQPRKL